MKLLLIDANSLIHRAFHALPPLTAPDGAPAGALYGLSATLLKVLDRHKPDYVAAAFDRPEPTFREEAYKEYKAQRPETPDELAEQLEEARRLFSVFGIAWFEKKGFEADDIIGTFAERFKKEKGVHTTILTGDLDTLQLVEDPLIAVEALKKGVSETVTYDHAAVIERYGIPPALITDYKGLVGDTSDNIPGIRGIGPKTAARLLNEYGPLEKVLANIRKDDRSYEKVTEGKQAAVLSKQLGTVHCDVPLEVSLEDLRFSPIKGNRQLIAYFKTWGFESLIKRLGGEEKKKEEEGAAASALPSFAVVENAEEATSAPQNAVLVAHEWKPILARVPRLAAQKLFDISIASWLLDPDKKDYSLHAIAERRLKESAAAEGTRAVLQRLFAIFHQKIESLELHKVFYDIELPLVGVLAAVEKRGVRIEKKALEKLKKTIENETATLAAAIYRAAGEEFNIASPKQVGEVLFEKMKIAKKGKKTKTGAYSTAEGVLAKLKDDHPIVRDILEHRENVKILGTYVEPLATMIGKDGKVHTTLLQTGTATGRISSEHPNLQNIPQGSKWSGPLRKAFVAEQGYKLVSFDYSQLELRLLAHLSGDKGLREVFLKGEDVHTMTASRVLGVTPSSVTKEARRTAKTLNFGIVYGMGPRAFSKTAGISEDEARRFINEYFRKFPGVKKWRETMIKKARTDGYVENENGRKRWFPNIDAGPGAAAEADRAAVNMPVQGLGADILKIAMVRTETALAKEGWSEKKARMILTIHDELLFEIADDILEITTRKLKTIMQECYPLSVPLLVGVHAGKNWGEMKEPTYEE